jgi:hypothetical protein
MLLALRDRCISLILCSKLLTRLSGSRRYSGFESFTKSSAFDVVLPKGQRVRSADEILFYLQLDALFTSLNPKGIRERGLQRGLERNYSKIR